MKYIYQNSDWPEFIFNKEEIVRELLELKHKQGHLLGRMQSLGFNLTIDAALESLTEEIVKSSEIEGKEIPSAEVRSSIARHLGIEDSGLQTKDRYVEGVVEMMLDATQKYDEPLTTERLFSWQSSLFPEGRSGMRKIIIGRWRNDSKGPMQIVSGPMGKEKIHFIAPPAEELDKIMTEFLFWFNSKEEFDPLVKAAIAHLWLVTIHPFADGNGRIARAITEMQLARAEKSSRRFYSMSSQIIKEKNEYYNTLEHTQKGGMDITEWLVWFLKCMMNSLNTSEKTLSKVLTKAEFWRRYSGVSLNGRQKLMLNKLLDDFKGKLTTNKWAKIAKCSADTALRDINDLLAKGILMKTSAGGRSTGYEVGS